MDNKQKFLSLYIVIIVFVRLGLISLYSLLVNYLKYVNSTYTVSNKTKLNLDNNPHYLTLYPLHQVAFGIFHVTGVI